MKNYKTTLVGLLGAVAQVVIPLIQNGHVTLEQLACAAGIAALGFLSKDFDITGNPPTTIEPPSKAE